MQLPGYTVTEEVYRGRTRMVYRGRRDRDGLPVVLKTFSNEVPAAAAGASLRREYDLLKDLDVPGVAGRMHRDVYYRPDFYPLGVTLDEMLTGRLPFDSTDPLEVVHCQIAKAPVAPSTLDGAIPGPLSAVVMKLLAKTAEERYQSG